MGNEGVIWRAGFRNLSSAGDGRKEAQREQREAGGGDAEKHRVSAGAMADHRGLAMAADERGSFPARDGVK